MAAKISEIISHGVTRYCLDLRRFGEGRKFFETLGAAEVYASDLGLDGGTRISDAERAEYVANRYRLKKVGATVTEAVTFFLRHHAGLKTADLLTAVVEFWSVKEEAQRRGRYVGLLKNTLEKFAKSEAVAPLNCHEVTRQHVEEWLQTGGWEPVTQEHYRGTLKTFFQWCLGRGYVTANPCSGIERIIVDTGEPGILTVEQCETLLRRALRPESAKAIPWLAVQLFGGLRPREANVLTWADIRGDHVFVKAEKSKTRQRRLVSVSKILRAWLDLGGQLPLANAPTHLLRLRYDGKVVNTKRKGSSDWTEVVPWSHDCLRHSFCSYHLARFRSAAKTASEAGHTETVLFKHYREIVSPSEARKFWALLPAACG